MQHILIVCDSSELPSFDKACEAFVEFSEALRKSPAPKVNLTSGQVPPTRNPAPLEFGNPFYQIQELRTVARQLCVEHELQQDATPIQTMIILSNLVKSLSAQIKNYEETPMPTSTYRPAGAKWKIGDAVQKKQGSHWRGKVVGYYSTETTPIGYSVESLFEEGSVQVWPEAALMDYQHCTNR